MKSIKKMISVVSFACVFMFIAGLSFVHGISQIEALKVTPDQFDFGTIEEGPAAVVTAIIENVGNIPVEITNVRTN